MEPTPAIDHARAQDTIAERAEDLQRQVQDAARQAEVRAPARVSPTEGQRTTGRVALGDPATTAEQESLRGVLVAEEGEADALREAVLGEAHQSSREQQASRAEQARAEQPPPIANPETRAPDTSSEQSPRAQQDDANEAQRRDQRASVDDPTEQFAVHDSAVHANEIAQAIERAEQQRGDDASSDRVADDRRADARSRDAADARRLDLERRDGTQEQQRRDGAQDAVRAADLRQADLRDMDAANERRVDQQRQERAQALRQAAPGTQPPQVSDRAQQLSGMQGVAAQGGGRPPATMAMDNADAASRGVNAIEGAPAVSAPPPGSAGTASGDGTDSGSGRT